MNKIQLAINVILVVAVATLFGLYITGNKSTNKEVAPTVEKMPLAYLNTDSLLANYTFAQEANEKLMKKQEDARLKINTKARNLQSEMEEFQRKLENNAFLSRERAENAQKSILKKQEDLQKLEAKLTEEIMIENQKLNIQLADTLTNFLKEYNADGRFHVILSNNAKDNVLMADSQYDITNEIIEQLNKRYQN
jgi:outer membrane protein